MKKGVIAGLLFLFVMLMNFASAAPMSLSEMLGQLDQSMVILFSVFIISFLLIFFALNKSLFKDNRPIAGLIAAVIAFLITYGVNQSGLDIENLLGSIGLSGGTLSIILGLVIVAGLVFMIIKLKLNSLFIIGGILIAGSFFVYTKTLFIAVGVILIIIRLILLGTGKGKKGHGREGGRTPKITWD